MTAAQLSTARRRLLDEKAELCCFLSGLDGYRESGAPRGDEGDVATASEGRESRARQIERALIKLGEIDVALARIASGVFGSCGRCSRPIGAARLRALPATDRCIDCAAVAEREAADTKYREAR